MSSLYLPVLSHFENENPWSASSGRLRYLVTPQKDGTLLVQTWEGPWAIEFSQIENTEVFPLSEEGQAQLLDWLELRRQEMEARPKRTLAENIARRDAAETARSQTPAES